VSEYLKRADNSPLRAENSLFVEEDAFRHNENIELGNINNLTHNSPKYLK